MKCKKPFQLGVVSCGCGQCMPCRINRRRIWTSRIILESLMHKSNTFVTLTYDQKNYPKNGSVDRRDIRLFVKRMRRALWPKEVRYFIVGEYGDKSQRPHYHAVLFGVAGCLRGRTRAGHAGISCCVNCKVMEGIWQKGQIYNGQVSLESVQYVVGYVLKGMTNKNSLVVEEKLKGRSPEFSRMSRHNSNTRLSSSISSDSRLQHF